MIAGLGGVGLGGGEVELREACQVAEVLTWSRRLPTEEQWLPAPDVTGRALVSMAVTTR